jgi:phage tail sheath protein FI
MALTNPSVSPAIVVKEVDLTGVAPNVETSLSGFVGNFQWGPVDEPIRIENEGLLASTFGTPDADNAVDYLSAAQFLRYSGNLIACREIAHAVGDSCLNATSLAVGTLINNFEDYEGQESTISDGSKGQWIARYPSELGNSLAVHVFSIEDGDSAGSATTVANWAAWNFSGEFDAIPGTSNWATNQPGTVTNDEIHIAVVDSDGQFTGTKGTVLEVFPFVSVAKGAKTTDGGDNYFASTLKNGSEYIYFGGLDSANSMTGTLWTTAPNGTVQDFALGVSWTEDSARDALGGGGASDTLGAAEYANGFDQFENAEEIDVQILIAPGMTSEDDQVTVVNDLAAIASVTRKDCVAVASPNRAAVVNNASPVTATVQTTDRFTASSYLIVDNNYLRVFDKYNEQFVYIPAASTVAGILAATDVNYGPWYSPAGEKRGQVNGATNVAYSPTKAERDTLYKAGVNSITQIAGRGILLFGDKTKSSRPSAFDRINVRRLFLAVEKSISEAARNFMFEFNDEFTRAEFVGVTEPLLREIQARRGIIDFYIQCDETNNTPAVVDRNEMVASIFIKPARAINYITLNFVAVRSGVSFEEVVGRV